MSLIDFVLKTFIREATGVADVEPEDRQQEIGSLGNLAEDVQDDDLALPDEDDEFMSGQEGALQINFLTLTFFGSRSSKFHNRPF